MPPAAPTSQQARTQLMSEQEVQRAVKEAEKMAGPQKLDIQTLKPGDIIEGRYKYVERIGKGAFVQVNLTANTDLHSAEDFKNLVIREEKGTLIRLGDLADVVLGAEDYNAEVRFSGQRAVFRKVGGAETLLPVTFQSERTLSGPLPP
jgi:multidrug efflux pump subunit AcrB